MDNNRQNVGSLVGGALLILIGGLALLAQLVRGFNFWNNLWPLIIIGIGLMFFIGMFAGGKSAAGLAIPGSIIAVIGLLLFAQNLTGAWETWAYGWTFILMAVGLGIFFSGLYAGDETQRKSGLRVLRLGIVFFILFGAFFELIFNSFPFSDIIFPALLILLGLYLLVVRSGILPKRRENPVDENVHMN